MNGRFVEQQDPGVLCHRHRQDRELALAERQLAHVALAQVLDADPADRRIDAPAVERARPAQRVLVWDAPESHELLDAHSEGHHGLARHDGEPARQRAARQLDHRSSFDHGRAFPGRGESGETAQQRRLAGAVGTDKRDQLAPPDRETDVVENPTPTVVDRQAARLERSVTHSSYPVL